MPILMKNGKMLMLNDEYELDFRASIRTTIMHELTLGKYALSNTFDESKLLIEHLTDKVIETIEFYREEKVEEHRDCMYCKWLKDCKKIPTMYPLSPGQMSRRRARAKSCHEFVYDRPKQK